MERISRVQPVKQVYKPKKGNQEHQENFAEILAKEQKKHHD